MDLLAALRLQIEWGADEALADEPLDRLNLLELQSPGSESPLRVREEIGPRPASQPGPPVSARSFPAVSSQATPPARAAALADAAGTVEELRAALAGFDGCGLRDTATNLVFADGNPDARLMLIGDAPGPDEDRSGRPFTGRAGAYLDRMLASIGLDRTEVLLTMLIPWRPPGNRPPTDTEIAACLPFLMRHIVLIRPQRLVLLGALPAKVLLGSRGSRGKPGGDVTWAEAAIPGIGSLPALVMPSPRVAMGTPAARKQSWTALRLLHRTIK